MNPLVEEIAAAATVNTIGMLLQQEAKIKGKHNIKGREIHEIVEKYYNWQKKETQFR